MTKTFTNLPWIVKVLLQFFLGFIGSGLYRILRFIEKKNIITLVVGILALCTGVGNFIFWLIDLVTVILSGKITVLAD